MASIPPVLIWQPEGGTPPGTLPPPAPLPGTGITNAGLTQLVNGQAYIDVVFDQVQVDNTWIFVECSVVNTTDPTPLNIWPGIITSKLTTGFRLQLNGMPDSNNYFLNWAVSGVNITPSPASTYLLTGPSSGATGVPSTYTVALPPSSTVSGSVTITPHDGGAGGTFSPTTVLLSTGSASATFTYTPAAYGNITISTTNSSSVLSDPAAIILNVPAPTYSLTGPGTGDVGVASTNFTVTLLGAVIGTLTVTPSSGGGGGTFTPTTVNLTMGAPLATFTYTPASVGAKTISVTNSGGLANPAPLTYTATAAVHLLNTLISYWKMDEGAAPFADSKGTNNLGGTTGGSFGGIIGNSAYRPALSIANNTSLQVTGSFTFSIWLRVDTPTSQQIFIAKGDILAAFDYQLFYRGDISTGFQFAAGTVPQASVGANVVAAFSWHHIVAWYDSVANKCFLRIDDATTYAGAAGGSLAQTTNDFDLGFTSFHALGWDGLIDEVGFWKRVLTAGEITALYNGGAGLPFSSFTA